MTETDATLIPGHRASSSVLFNCACGLKLGILRSIFPSFVTIRLTTFRPEFFVTVVEGVIGFSC